MLPKTIDVLDMLEKIAPFRLAETWDNSGLQTGSYSQEISKIFMALDPTIKALKSAYKRHSQLLLTHHPLIFKPLSLIDINTYPGNVIVEAARNSISIIAAHTNLDVAAGGINDIMADLLNLQNIEVLKETPGMDGVGLGRVGDLRIPENLSAVVKNVKRIFKINHPIKITQRDIQINRIAVVGGAGGGFVSTAAQKGADILITGDIGHHHALEANMLGIVLMDAGHFHTEKIAFSHFADHLRNMSAHLGWGIEIETYEEEIDPINEGLGN